MPTPPNMRLVVIGPQPSSCPTTNSVKLGDTATAIRIAAAVGGRGRARYSSRSASVGATRAARKELVFSGRVVTCDPPIHDRRFRIGDCGSGIGDSTDRRGSEPLTSTLNILNSSLGIMRRMRTTAALLTLTLASLAGLPLRAQGPVVRARIDAFVKALSSGSPEQYEAMARDNFTTDLLARPADQRRQAVQRVHDDFGELTIAGEDMPSPTHVDLEVTGRATDMRLAIAMDFDAAHDYRIAQLGIRAGGPAGGRGGRGGRPPLPKAPISAAMSAAELSAAL